MLFVHLTSEYMKKKLQANVKFVEMHFGHENEVCHLTISPTKKQEVAQKLFYEVPPNVILDEVRESVTSIGDKE